MNMSTYLEEKVLNHVFRNTEYVRPATVYAGIVTSTGTDEQLEAGTLTNEVSGYTGNRPSVAFEAPSQEDGKATIVNTAAVEFEGMPAVTVGYVIVTDSATKGEGNVLYWCPLVDGEGDPVTKTSNAGDTFRIKAGELTLDLA